MSDRASREDIFGWVSDILRSEFQCAADQLSMGTHLIDELDLDSIDAIDLSVRLEEKTEVTFQEDDLKAIRTIADVVDFIDGRLG